MEITAGLSLELARAVARHRYGFGPVVQRSWAEGDDITTRTGLSAHWSYRAVGPCQLDLGASWLHKTRPDRTSSNGPEWQIAPRYTRIPAQTFSWYIGAGYYEVTPKDEPHNSYTGKSASLGMRYLWKGGAVSDFGLEAGARRFDGAAFARVLICQ